MLRSFPLRLLTGLTLPPAAIPAQTISAAKAQARRAADCANLRAEVDANRLRNVPTTRRYYSTEDVEPRDALNSALAADDPRFCSR